MVRTMLCDMASDWTTGLFTLAGAVVGGSGTLVVNWLTTKNQRFLALVARAQSLRDRQYAEHKDYLARLDLLLFAANALLVAAEAQGESGELERLHTEYVEAGIKFIGARGGAELVAPPELLATLAPLSWSAGDYVQKINEWWRRRARSVVANASLDFGCDHKRLLSEVHSLRQAYLESAAKIVGRGGDN